MITTTATPTLTAVKSNAPFSLAFGAVLVISSALSATAPITDWTVVRTYETPGTANYASGTSSGQRLLKFHTESSRSPGENVSELRAISGLTADQVGRLLGVSRRSVQNWLAGNVMAAQHAEQVSQLLAVIQGLHGSTAEERRSALLDSSQGESLFHKLLMRRVEASKVLTRPLSVAGRIAL